MGSTTLTGNPEAVIFKLPCLQCGLLRAIDKHHSFGCMLKPGELCHYVCGKDLSLADYPDKVLGIRKRHGNEVIEVLTKVGEQIVKEGCRWREKLTHG